MLNKLHDALGLRTTPAIFFYSALFIVLFSVLTMALPGPMLGIFGHASDFLMTYLGWFYILGATGFFLFLLYIAASRFGRVRLGPDDSRPVYSGPAWFGMMFAAGVGSLLMFWGIAEPINHFAVPPQPGVEPGSPEAAMDAIATTDLHLGLFMWAILAVPALCFGYFTYKRKLPPRVSSAFQPLLGDGIHGPIGKAIDILTLVGSVFGLAVSVGLGALQLNSGLAHQYGVPYTGPLQAIIIAIITAMGLASLLSGMDKGIKRLSNINIVMAVAFMIFVLMAGTSMFVLQGTIESIGHFVARLPQMALFNHTFGDSSWLGQWTVFYWAWDICWAPFVGLFIAKISQGRTIRQFVLGVLGLPTLFTMVWVGVFGMSSFDIELNGSGGLVERVVDEGDIPGALFHFLGNYPWLPVTAVAVLLLILIFFVTTIDSGALVMDSIANGHEGDSPKRQRVFWAISIGLICASVLLVAGENGLTALQNIIIVIGFPIFILAYLQVCMIMRALKEDAGELPPMKTRQWKQVLPVEEYRRRATDDWDSVQEYGMRPEFDEETGPEYETRVPQTTQMRQSKPRDGAEEDAADAGDGGSPRAAAQVGDGPVRDGTHEESEQTGTGADGASGTSKGPASDR